MGSPHIGGDTPSGITARRLKWEEIHTLSPHMGYTRREKKNDEWGPEQAP